MNVYKETIWHFTCKVCSGFWSIAASDKWTPTELFCPHCSSKRTYDNELVDIDNDYKPTNSPMTPDPDIDYEEAGLRGQVENYLEFEKEFLKEDNEGWCSCGHKIIECDCKAGCECGCRKQFLRTY